MAAVIGNREISLGVMGGTLITAACYSGGNVFGCSPYDAATTRYLKATYGAYWQAIREFGFANPQVVPFINEDNDLIVSLVEVGKERIVTIRNKSVSNHLYNGLIMPFKLQDVGSMSMRITCEHNNGMIVVGSPNGTYNSMSGYYSYGGSNGISITITRTGTWELNKMSDVGLTFAANTKTQFVRLCGWSNTGWNYDIKINKWDIFDTQGNALCQLVPFIDNGEVCFLSLTDLSLHKNVFTDPFTIELTDTPT